MTNDMYFIIRKIVYETGEDLYCSHLKPTFGHLKYITCCDIIYDAFKTFPGHMNRNINI